MVNKIKNNTLKNITYKDAGVDIEAGNNFVKEIAPLVKETERSGVMGSIGGFGGLFNLSKCGYKNPILVSATDGVGTKLLIAEEIDKHDTIGIDLVAMSVNDIVVQGAEPLFFLDYFATGKLKLKIAKEIIKGITHGVKLANCALLGGETAELPDIYSDNNYDLAGFALGAVEEKNILPKNTIKTGDLIIGLQSSGIHSNGFSLVRKVLQENNIKMTEKISDFKENSIGLNLLTPTKIYVKSILNEHKLNNIKACAHITGGGLIDNLPRVIPNDLTSVIYGEKIKPNFIFRWLKNIGNIKSSEMLKTFNCGIGMCVIVEPSKADQVINNFIEQGEEAAIIGELKTNSENSKITIINENKMWIN
ncbi:MAG: phosphoribosylformylglycinamidine cyclo-ligase [Pelagibacterales bacterium]|nr:phosphoribosylformylglycinamidine cyclo-ligase [Pelagibacterales bacterium]PPR17165.1 MAG: Phosphoribosylformylglycinamidine cyclo-ligase [Alphaproteobacteria bacterium MarineAlpha9_Bin3]|tara:strand:- start:7801 stop:8889 length:1089 start_codon:yes stop_codon:yes gene_type:complete